MTAPEEQRGILMCATVLSGPAAVVSSTESCAMCLTDVWVTLSLAPAVQRHELIPFCVPCVIDRVGKGGTFGGALRAEQVEQLRELGLLDIAQDLVDLINLAGGKDK